MYVGTREKVLFCCTNAYTWLKTHTHRIVQKIWRGFRLEISRFFFVRGTKYGANGAIEEVRRDEQIGIE